MTTSIALPQWDMSVIFPSLESPEFEQSLQGVVADLAALADLFDARRIDQQPAAPVDAAMIETLETVTSRFNTLLERVYTLGAYIQAFVTTNSRDTTAQARFSEFQQHMVQLAQLSTRFTAWIGSLDVETLIEQSAVARDHAFMLRKAKRQAAHLMSPVEEALVAELNVTGSSAWAKLHSDLTSQMMVAIEVDGESRTIPMSELRNLAFNPDREVRRRAYEAELAAWEDAAVSQAAALNSIKGAHNTLSRRRGWDSPLDEALLDNHIDRETLDAMMTAAHESFPDFRRYLRAKARALGLPALAWYDLFAPVGESSKIWEWEAAEQFIVEQFGTYSDRMSAFAARAFDERWIDAEPRAGKVGGAFCMPIREGESRILSNYQAAFNGVSTLAHELGHAYHNLNLAGRTMLQRDTPMTLAETASIFCETIIRHAGLNTSNAQEQIAILEASLQGACQVVVDICSRFIFETSVFEARRRRELSVDEFNQLMLDAQRQTYGDGLAPDLLHPYMWIVKGHYYGAHYYNYPYMFGMLFGLGLYARYQADPEAFKQSYDDLLSSTGLADAATLAERFGINIRTPDFWRASFAIVRGDIDRFEQLIAAGTPAPTA